MKLREAYIETWEERYKIYRLDGDNANGAAVVLDGANNNKFLAAFSYIEEARDFVCGWPKKDCEGITWHMENGAVEVYEELEATHEK